VEEGSISRQQVEEAAAKKSSFSAERRNCERAVAQRGMRAGEFNEATVAGPLGFIDVSDVASYHEPAAAVGFLNDQLIGTVPGCLALFFTESNP
jgi:hypothetical protein